VSAAGATAAELGKFVEAFDGVVSMRTGLGECAELTWSDVSMWVR
jgi:hypothetical protein